MHIAVDLVGHGRRGRLNRQLRYDQRQERHLPVHPARQLRDDTRSSRARRTSPTSEAARTTPETSRTRSPASPRSARCGCSFEHQFAAILRSLGADGQRRARREPGLPPPGCVPGDRLSPTRTTARRPGVAAVRHRLEQRTSPRSSARPRISAATSSAISATACTRMRNAPNNNVAATVTYNACTSNDSEGYLLDVIDSANRLQGTKGRSGAGSWSRQSPAPRRRTPSTGRRRAPPTPRAARPPARGR